MTYPLTAAQETAHYPLWAAGYWYSRTLSVRGNVAAYTHPARPGVRVYVYADGRVHTARTWEESIVVA